MPLNIAPVPAERPLPERIRPLEGVGFWNAMDNAGYRKREWRWAGPVSALIIAAGVLFIAWRAIA